MCPKCNRCVRRLNKNLRKRHMLFLKKYSYNFIIIGFFWCFSSQTFSKNKAPRNPLLSIPILNTYPLLRKYSAVV